MPAGAAPVATERTGAERTGAEHAAAERAAEHAATEGAEETEAGRVGTPPEVLGATSRVLLRRMRPRDEGEFVRLAVASVDLHRPWIKVPTTPADFRVYSERFDGVTAESLLICRRRTGDIVGFVTINQIFRGPYQRGTLGYGVFEPYARRGYMWEGLRTAVTFAFEELALHRLEADIQPDNQASVNLVKRLGFRKEGFSPGFILIDGSWRDHERWAITRDMDLAPGAISR